MEMSEEEQQQRREALHEMFQSEGWSILKEGMDKSIEALKDISLVKDESDLHFRKGKLHSLNELLFLQEQVKDAV